MGVNLLWGSFDRVLGKDYGRNDNTNFKPLCQLLSIYKFEILPHSILGNLDDPTVNSGDNNDNDDKKDYHSKVWQGTGRAAARLVILIIRYHLQTWGDVNI